MGYSNNPSMVRVDFFKASGKWYTTEAVEWLDYYGDTLEAFRESLKFHLNGRLNGLTAVCIEPYSECKTPVMTLIL